MLSLLGGRFFQIILSVLQIRLATTILKPSEYGTWILLLTTSNMFIFFGISPLGLYVNRHLAEWKQKDLLSSVFKFYSLYIFSFSAVASFITLIILSAEIQNFPGLSHVLSSSLILFLMAAQAFHQTWIPALNFIGERRKFILGSILSILITLVMASLLHLVGCTGVTWWVLSVAMGNLVAGFSFIPQSWLSNSSASKLVRNLSFSSITAFSGPLLIGTLLTWLHTQGYRFIIEEKLGFADFGKFAAGYGVVMSLYGAVESVVSNYYLAPFFKNINDSKDMVADSEINKIWDITLVPYFISGAYLYLVAPVLSVILLGSDFRDDTNDWIGLVAVAEGGRVLFNVFANVYHGQKKTLRIILPQILGVVTTFSLLFISDKLSFERIVASIALGYLVTIIALYLTGLRFFGTSNLFKGLISSIFPASGLIAINLILKSHLDPISLAILTSVITSMIMIPYFLKLKRINYE